MQKGHGIFSVRVLDKCFIKARVGVFLPCLRWPVPNRIGVVADCAGYNTAASLTRFPTCPILFMICLWGQALALYYLGVSFVTLMVTELDPDCFELLKIVHHAINDPITFWNYGHDMTKRRHVADVDLYLGTSPCQDFSNAGQGRGLHWPCLLKVYLWFYPSEFACRNQRCKRQTVVRADREDPARASSGRELISGFDSKFASNKSASKAFMLENVKGLLTPPVCSR